MSERVIRERLEKEKKWFSSYIGVCHKPIRENIEGAKIVMKHLLKNYNDYVAALEEIRKELEIVGEAEPRIISVVLSDVRKNYKYILEKLQIMRKLISIFDKLDRSLEYSIYIIEKHLKETSSPSITQKLILPTPLWRIAED